MKNLYNEITLLSFRLAGDKGRKAAMIVTIALFILAAGAPNGTIGIGK